MINKHTLQTDVNDNYRRRLGEVSESVMIITERTAAVQLGHVHQPPKIRGPWLPPVIRVVSHPSVRGGGGYGPTVAMPTVRSRKQQTQVSSCLLIKVEVLHKTNKLLFCYVPVYGCAPLPVVSGGPAAGRRPARDRKWRQKPLSRAGVDSEETATC